MEIRLQNTERGLDVDIEHPYLLNYPEVFAKKLKPQLDNYIIEGNAVCDGCGSLLYNKAWLSTVISSKGKWRVFLFCYDTRVDCAKKWEKKRK